MKKPVNPKGSVTFPVGVYSGRVLLCLTRKAYAEAHKVLDPKEEHEAVDLDTVRGMSSRHEEMDHKSVYLVAYFDRKPPTLVHELLHTTVHILSHAGVPITAENDEALAYLLDSLYESALSAMNRRH